MCLLVDGPGTNSSIHPRRSRVELERRLTANQRERVATAFRNAGAEAVQGLNLVLHGIIDPEDRRRFDVPGIGGASPGAPRLKAGTGKR